MARAGSEIPGYSGYVPGQMPHAVVGHTFKDSNEKALSGEATIRIPPTERADWKPRQGQGAAPGYCGHIPNKVDSDVFGGTEQAIKMHAAGDANATAAGRLRPHEVNSSRSTAHPGSAKMAIAGYSGYIPGKTSENVIGRTVTVANNYAQKERELISSGYGDRNEWRRSSAPGIETRRGSGTGAGKTIPGYTGYIPGKNPEGDVVGRTFAATNIKAEKFNKWTRGYGPPPTPSGPSIAESSDCSTSLDSASIISGSKVSGSSRNSLARSARSSKNSAASGNKASAPSMQTGDGLSVASSIPRSARSGGSQKSSSRVNLSGSGSSVVVSESGVPQSGTARGSRTSR